MTPREDLAIDLPALGTALRGWGVDVDGSLTGVRVGVGQSNLTYLVTDQSGSRWVARRPPRGALLASAHDVEREARILESLADTDVPVPRVHGVAPLAVFVEHCRDAVLRAGEPVRLTPRAFRLLELLIRRAPKAVSKRDLLDHVWSGADDVVGEPVSDAPSDERALIEGVLRELSDGAGVGLVRGDGQRVHLCPSGLGPPPRVAGSGLFYYTLLRGKQSRARPPSRSPRRL